MATWEALTYKHINHTDGSLARQHVLKQRSYYLGMAIHQAPFLSEKMNANTASML